MEIGVSRAAVVLPKFLVVGTVALSQLVPLSSARCSLLEFPVILKSAQPYRRLASLAAQSPAKVPKPSGAMMQRVAEHLATAGPAASSPSTIIRWGVMGTANIADVVLPALAAAPGCEVLACASRTTEKATAWAAERNIPRAYGSYQELLEDADIDAVYIPLPTILHLEWVRKAAAAKKHILVEKPVAVTSEDAQTLVDACETAGVFLMDAVHWMHNPRTPKFVDAVHSTCGAVRRVNASFCFPAHRREKFFEDNIRATGADPLGSLGDLGWYTIRGILVAMDWELPTTVTAQGTLLDNGTPLAVVATLQFASGCLATMDCGFDVENREVLEVSGRDGTVRVDGFVLVSTPPFNTPQDGSRQPTAVANSYRLSAGQNRLIDGLPTGERTTTFDINQEVTTPMPLSQEAEMMKRFSEIVAVAGTEMFVAEQKRWSNFILQTQAVLDAVLSSLRAGGTPVEL